MNNLKIVFGIQQTTTRSPWFVNIFSFQQSMINLKQRVKSFNRSK
jgi:hypothetical protein